VPTHKHTLQAPPLSALPARSGSFPATGPNDVTFWLIRELDGIKDSLRDQGATMDRKFDTLEKRVRDQGATMGRKFDTLEKSIDTLEKSVRDAQTASEKSVREVNASVKDIKMTLMWLGFGGGGLLAVLQFVLAFKSEVAGFLKSL
jgi:hypothetical protein